MSKEQSKSDTQVEREQKLHAVVDFVCLNQECGAVVKFDVLGLQRSKGKVVCPECRREYHFDRSFLDKLQRLRKLIFAVRDAEDILGDINVAVTTPMGEVKVPYRLLLTRLNTTITIGVGGTQVDFNFRIEPLSDGGVR
ncbi:MAG: hypothetical protein K9N51_03630 [Candidatus Pacebacteria bacterium]|nr:hypothetical protein [Candidatus Paceibacterota bacterium]